ncbi:AfsA-related hotdog domain-containing protein [Streptomyces rubellomurinus]|uniref:AfsA-related hotdog domain-containing protein n=1 Tax=Streptomyces sp. Y1 TaxID=3238634 RepID=A0AB39TLE1_9ACTN|nr:AfsA-related hotdog domain-containing protein [Streptomyces rubellomurinus]
MTMLDSSTDPHLATAGDRLSFDRTISRRLVQRDGLQEVFLTDFRARFDRSFLAGARLPHAHPYYNDHLHAPRLHDPLVLLESVRQAVRCATGTHPDAPPEAVAFTLGRRLRITAPDALAAGPDLDELELRGHESRTWCRKGALTRVVHRVDLVLDGRQLGTATTDTALRPPAAYRRLRLRERADLPPRSDELPVREHPGAVPPYLLGRQRPENVVLLEPRFAAGELAAGLRVPLGHSSLFDQRPDHVPGAVLLEAARQAGLLLVGEEFGRSPARTVLLAVELDHRRFVELDEETTVRARLAQPPGAADGLPVRVEFRRRGTLLAEARLRLAGTERGRR